MTDARTLTLQLGGKWRGGRGGYGLAPCPICQPQGRRDQRGLEISHGRTGRLLLQCHKSHCAFSDLLAALNVTPERTASDPEAEARWRAEEEAQIATRGRWAQRVWDGTRPIGGSLAEIYLRSRGITCPLPTSLRFAPALHHPSREAFPALVARVEGGAGLAVHRTWLRPDGCGKADTDPPKAMLGAVAGGAVRLVEPPRGADWPLVVAEGIETALSLPCGLLHSPAAVWAALSAVGIEGLRLPPAPGRLYIAADGDPRGLDAAYRLAERAQRQGWRVGVRAAPDGQDWNDVLQSRRAAA